jgi:hypothetical protein
LFLLQRFIPSEFTNDVDRAHIVEPATGLAASKAKIRRAIGAEGIPYTHVWHLILSLVSFFQL